jgi:hypothetical protein
MIAQINSMASAPSEKLAPLSREKLLAVTFTQLESLLNAIQNGHIQQILQLYYSYWLHRSADLLTPRLIAHNRMKFSKQCNYISSLTDPVAYKFERCLNVTGEVHYYTSAFSCICSFIFMS